MVIKVIDIAAGANTEAQGEAVLRHLRDSFLFSDKIIISFEGIHTATSSFVNAAFVPLLDAMSFDEIKMRLKIVSSAKQINDMVRARLLNESRKVAA